MLSLYIKSGDYITIGNDIVVQVFRDGPDARVTVKAPKEMTILRGEVLERTQKKPEGLLSKRPKSTSEQKRDMKRFEKLAEKKAYFETQKQQLLAIAGKMEQLTGAINDPNTSEQLRQLAISLLCTVSAAPAGEDQGA